MKAKSSSPTFDGNVPCNGCTLCCKNDLVRLMIHEVTKYEHEPHPFLPNSYMLAHKPNGDCHYLTENGCSIHETKPIMCRTMDCRNIAISMNHHLAAHLRLTEVWQRGTTLIKESPK